MGYLKFLKKDRKKAFKWSLKAMLLDILQTEDSYIDVDMICENEKVILLSFIFILFYF